MARTDFIPAIRVGKRGITNSEDIGLSAASDVLAIARATRRDDGHGDVVAYHIVSAEPNQPANHEGCQESSIDRTIDNGDWRLSASLSD